MNKVLSQMADMMCYTRPGVTQVMYMLCIH